MHGYVLFVTGTWCYQGSLAFNDWYNTHHSVPIILDGDCKHVEILSIIESDLLCDSIKNVTAKSLL